MSEGIKIECNNCGQHNNFSIYRVHMYKGTIFELEIKCKVCGEIDKVTNTTLEDVSDYKSFENKESD